MKKFYYLRKFEKNTFCYTIYFLESLNQRTREANNVSNTIKNIRKRLNDNNYSYKAKNYAFNIVASMRLNKSVNENSGIFPQIEVSFIFLKKNLIFSMKCKTKYINIYTISG